MRRLAFPLWLVLLLLIAGLLLPWQMGIDLQKNLPSKLEHLAEGTGVQVTFSDYRRGIWQSTAQLHLSSTLLHEPVLLNLTLQHGPWLGFSSKNESPWGWSSILVPMPISGGLSVYPANENFAWMLRVDLLGRTHLYPISHNQPSDQPLGQLMLQTTKQGELAKCTGELRLPGLKLQTPQGDVILADISVQSNLQRENGHIQGDLRVDAQRAAWVMSVLTQNQLSPSILIEQPRVSMLLHGKALASQFTLNWQDAQGIRFDPVHNPTTDIGRLNARLNWQNLDWIHLLDNLEIHTLTLPVLTRALSEGVLNLEQFELTNPEGKLSLSAHLQTQARAQDGRDLDFSLNAQMDRRWLVQCLLDYDMANNMQEAEQRLATLHAQGLIESDNTAQISTSISLWHGELAVNARRFPLSQLLSGTH